MQRPWRQCTINRNERPNYFYFICNFLPPYYDTGNYRNGLEYGKKAQRNHEAYTTWAFPANLQKMITGHLVTDYLVTDYLVTIKKRKEIP